jgi:CRP/FNR family transcriptional regulator, cyclic AMP receptor protein
LEGAVQRSLEFVLVFRGLSLDRRHKVEKACHWRQIDAGGEIVTHEDTSRDVFFLTSGRARSIIYAATGTVVAFGDVVPGSMFGEIAAIDGKPRSVAVEATETSIVANLSHLAFLDLFKSEPEFAFTVLEQMTSNIRGLTARVFEFSTKPVNNRVQAELLRLALANGAVSGSSVVLVDTPTHADFAARISTHREAVTREFSRLTKLGLLKKSNGDLVITDVPRLKAMVQDGAEI